MHPFLDIALVSLGVLSAGSLALPLMVFSVLGNEQKLKLFGNWFIPFTLLHVHHHPVISLITITRDPCGEWHCEDQTEVLSSQRCAYSVTVMVHVNHGGSLRLETVCLPLLTVKADLGLY